MAFRFTQRRQRAKHRSARRRTSAHAYQADTGRAVHAWGYRAMRYAATFGLLLAPVSQAIAAAYPKNPFYFYSIDVTEGDPNHHRILHGGSVATFGDQEHAIKALRSGMATLEGTAITTARNDAYGVYFSGAATLFLKDITIETSGDRAHGLASFTHRGDDVPEWANAKNGQLVMESGRITVKGSMSHGVNAIGQTGSVHLGRLLPDLTVPGHGEREWRFPTTGHPWSVDGEADAAVVIRGTGSRNTGIEVAANPFMTLNGVWIALEGGNSTGMLVHESGVARGGGLWITSDGENSTGLRALGRRGCRIAADVAPVCLTRDAMTEEGQSKRTLVQMNTGRIHMRAVNSPAVEVRRAEVHLRDFTLRTEAGTPYTVSNQAGRFRLEGQNGRAAIYSEGAALQAWTGAAKEAAVFELSNADVHSASYTLLDVLRSPEVPSSRGRFPTSYAILTLNGANATGRIQGVPEAKVHVNLLKGSVWHGDTVIGEQVRIEDGSVWAMAHDSTVQTLSLQRDAAVRFADRNPGMGRPQRFHTLTIQGTLKGEGHFDMRTHIALEKGDMIVVGGVVQGSYAVFITEFSGKDDGPGRRIIPLFRARSWQGKKPVLKNVQHVSDVDAKAYRYVLREHKGIAGTTWWLERQPIAGPTAPAPVTPPTGKSPGGQPTDQGRPTANPTVPAAGTQPIRENPKEQPGGQGRPVDGPAVSGPGTQPTEKGPNGQPADSGRPVANPAAPVPGTQPNGKNPNGQPADQGRPAVNPAAPAPEAQPNGNKLNEQPADQGRPIVDPADPAAPASGALPAEENPNEQPANEDSSADDTLGDSSSAGVEASDKDVLADDDLPVLYIDTPPLADADKVVANASGIAAAQTLWNASLQTFHDRFRTLRPATALASDPRLGNSPDTGVWIRGVDARQHITSPVGGSYTQNIYGFTLGADRPVDVAAGRWHIGAAVSHAQTDRKQDEGKSRAKGTLLSLYAVLRANDGTYAGAMASVGRMDHTLAAKDLFTGKATGRFRNWGAGASMLVGRHVALPRQWFVEPEIGTDYFRASGARYELSNGMSVRDRGGYSLQARAQVRTGKTLTLRGGAEAAPYARLGLAHEFGNRSNIQADGIALGTNMSGTRVEAGVGAEVRVKKAHHLYADFSYGKGKRLEQARAVTVGYRYQW